MAKHEKQMFEEKHPKYGRYGGRGIKICDDWMTIDGFASWALANGWQEGLTLDRIDNDAGIPLKTADGYH